MKESRSIGMVYIPQKGAKLRLWAPSAKSVQVKINNTDRYDLQPVAYGFWESEILPVVPGDKYLIMLNNQSFPDPLSLWQPEGVHKASRIFDTGAYTWNDSTWNGISAEELIIYELHTGTFTEAGTFEAIISKLEYLRDLGITAIELMPVNQFPGSRNWGYDGVYPFAVQSSYGGAGGLQYLVDVCHQKGIAVILDVVYNHLGPEGNYLPAFGPVFTDKYKTPWGQAINFDDAWSDGIRELVTENVLMWFRDFHIDGLRLDAVHAIKDFGNMHILQYIQDKVQEFNSRLNRKHFLIVESDLNDTKFISPVATGGYNMDATWCDEFHHAIHALSTGETKGYYSDFGSVHLLEKSLNSAFAFDGIWSEHRKRFFGTRTEGIPGHKFVVFIQNHDQVGNRLKGDRLPTLVSFEMLKVLAGTMMLSPFTPLLFMGEEYGETNPFYYFTSHSDNTLIEQVREGRKNEFKFFQTGEDVPDPQAESTFFASRLNWDKRSVQQNQLIEFYKELIHLRKTNPVLKSTSRNSPIASTWQNRNVIILHREVHKQMIWAILNFENSEIEIQQHEQLNQNGQLILCSSDKKWGGPGFSFEQKQSVIQVPAQSIMVLNITVT
ncbi:MAG: malto-oligosyltrehalose trehalohydrolase [Bacteroidales bacterium]|nr:malto-oligosyltrehalose trehalohydrolase [Bacteroidales bacterium]